jgi:hypothetical protein
MLLGGEIFLVQHNSSTRLGVDEGQNDVVSEMINIVVLGLPAVISPEATVEHRQLVLLGFFLRLAVLGKSLEPRYLGSESKRKEES